MNRILILALIGTVAACSNEPAGGRGPFDPVDLPPIQDRYPSTINAPSANTQLQPLPTDQQVNAGQAQSDDPLLRDVAQALDGTNTTTASVAPDPNADIGIDPNDQSLNLSLSTQEQQRAQREEAERRRIAAQQQLVIIEPESAPQVNANANVVGFARSTTHPVGQKVYKRDVFRSRSQSKSACRGFSSDDEAQRQFLANDGPQEDRFNLDPDGDGFACNFDPEAYRKLQF